MPKADPIDKALAELKALRASSDRSNAIPSLRQLISSKQNLIAEKAAKLAGEWELTDLENDLVAAFDRFMKNGADKGCGAKTEVARALDRMHSREQSLFVTGVHHHQPEAAWGPPVDVAAELRGICAAALVRLNYHDVLSELADLLMDSEPAARLAAVRAIEYRGAADDAGAALLRLKLLAGDAHVDVVIEAIGALLKLLPTKSLPFVQEHFLDARVVDQDVKNSALLSIGETRTPEAFELLKSRLEQEVRADSRKPLLLALAVMRIPPATDFLLELIEREPKAMAAAALEAMRLYKSDSATTTKIAAAIDRRGESQINELFEKLWRQ